MSAIANRNNPFQSQPDHDHARTLAAVLAHQERTGAVVMAEGIETEEHLEQALALGASLGQGYLFGRPDSLGQHSTTRGWSLPVRKNHPWPTLGSGSPFELISQHCPLRIARKETLIAFTRQIEYQARRAADPPKLLAALPKAR